MLHTLCVSLASRVLLPGQQKTGYTYYLKNIYKDKYNIYNFGFGSMHLKDAGMVFIQDVLKCKPEYCIIDWFSTGDTYKYDKLEIYLNTLIREFTLKKCKLIFLFLPAKSNTVYIKNKIPYFNMAKKN